MMEALPASQLTKELGKILCCECGTPIDPNPANLCVACLRTQVDITEGIPKQVNKKSICEPPAICICADDDPLL